MLKVNFQLREIQLGCSNEEYTKDRIILFHHFICAAFPRLDFLLGKR